MKNIIAGMMFLSTTAFASSVSIQSFSVIRSGGGQIEVEVFQEKTGEVIAYTKSCRFKQLSQMEKANTHFKLSGNNVSSALSILNNKAVIASDESIRHPLLATGTWRSVQVNYSYEFDGSVKNDQKEINAPIIIINSKVSNVLNDIEQQARLASGAFCLS